MTEKRFTINGTWGKSLNRLKGVICDNNKDMYITDVVNLLNDLSEENEQLRQRNTNQCNQLTELWEIIEEENWEKLIAMKKQLKEDEERLQKEWGCYE